MKLFKSQITKLKFKISSVLNLFVICIIKFKLLPYTGCHKYVPFASFAKRRKYNV